MNLNICFPNSHIEVLSNATLQQMSFSFAISLLHFQSCLKFFYYFVVCHTPFGLDQRFLSMQTMISTNYREIILIAPIKTSKHKTLLDFIRTLTMKLEEIVNVVICIRINNILIMVMSKIFWEKPKYSLCSYVCDFVNIF